MRSFIDPFKKNGEFGEGLANLAQIWRRAFADQRELTRCSIVGHDVC
jgi:hypothetical protein